MERTSILVRRDKVDEQAELMGAFGWRLASDALEPRDLGQGRETGQGVYVVGEGDFVSMTFERPVHFGNAMGPLEQAYLRPRSPRSLLGLPWIVAFNLLSAGLLVSMLVTILVALLQPLTS